MSTIQICCSKTHKYLTVFNFTMGAIQKDNYILFGIANAGKVITT